MKKIFLDKLPRKGKNIDWQNSGGCKVHFVYDDIEGVIEIVKYSATCQLDIKYLDEYFTIKTNNLTRCKIGKIIGKKTNKFKYGIGQVFKDDKRDLIITDREYREKIRNNGRTEKQKVYKYTCNKCGWAEGWIEESSLKRGYGCISCARQVVTPQNSIWATDSWMIDLGVSEEDAKKYTKGSDEKIEVVCPNCYNKKSMRIADIYTNKSIGCTCGDGYSYPEKFVSNMLSQLGVDYITQITKNVFEWCNNKRYDFYLPKYKCVIEVHGRQHYEQQKRKGARTLAEEQDNDRIKRELALNNGIEHYIELDCRYSDLDCVRGSVLNSELNKLFNLSKIDWLEIERFSIKSNKVKEVCEYWNNKEEWETTQTIADKNKWGIKSKQCIISYLKKGTKLGWTNYDPKEEMRKSALSLVSGKNGRNKE